jgi:HlyD family secretion protein
MNKKAKLAIGVVVLAAAGGTVGMMAMKKGVQVVDVKIDTVGTRDVVESVIASGSIRPRTKVDVQSDIAGKIVTLAVQEGELVTKGQFLVEIDGEQAEAALQRAEAALSSTRASEVQSRARMDQDQRNYTRNLEIRRISPTVVSEEQMEQLKTASEVSKAVHEASLHSVAQATASVRDARTSLGKTKLYAPMAGRITRLNITLGETAVTGAFNKDAATLLTISDMSVLETKVKVDETDVTRIKVGDSTEVKIDAFPDSSYVGRVTKVSNSSTRIATATDQAVDYEVTIQLLNPSARTRPDFSATARIVTKTERGLAVPIIAVTVRENTPLPAGDTAITSVRPPTAAEKKVKADKDIEGVFVIDTANKVTFRPVTLGISGDEYVIVSGLKAGERIVSGTFQAIRDLKDGMVVRDIKLATPPDAKKPPQGTTP